MKWWWLWVICITISFWCSFFFITLCPSSRFQNRYYDNHLIREYVLFFSAFILLVDWFLYWSFQLIHQNNLLLLLLLFFSRMFRCEVLHALFHINQFSYYPLGEWNFQSNEKTKEEYEKTFNGFFFSPLLMKGPMIKSFILFLFFSCVNKLWFSSKLESE